MQPINTTKARLFFDSIDMEKAGSYIDYWESLRPQSKEDIFRRYLFAFCSVHTTWRSNIKGYNSIKDLGWLDSKQSLLDRLQTSGCGFHNGRTNNIWEFKEKFFQSPQDFYFTSKKCHVLKRDKIVSKIKGLGFAKVSFALEMIHPNEARVFCADVHLLRLFDLEGLGYSSSNASVKIYKRVERNWTVACGRAGVPNYIGRVLYWNQIQKQENCKYWAHVLEPQ